MQRRVSFWRHQTALCMIEEVNISEHRSSQHDEVSVRSATLPSQPRSFFFRLALCKVILSADWLSSGNYSNRCMRDVGTVKKILDENMVDWS
jgi:hypothetical protein